MQVGFIGLGRMGTAMAGRLLQAGHEVSVYNRTPNKAQDLIDRGARLAAQVRDACQGDAIITILPTASIAEAVDVLRRRLRPEFVHANIVRGGEASE